MRHQLMVLLAVLCAAPAAADRVDDFVDAELRRQRIPGVSIAVVRRGKVVKAKGYGLANVELPAPATRDSVFQIASVSKQFVAAALMLLAQDGKLAVTDPLGKHLGGVPETWNGVTLRHLLTHTSGIASSLPGWTLTTEWSDEQVLKAAAEAPVRVPPGEQWEYNSIGYHLLGTVVRRHTGKPWQEFLAERLFRPLGMTATRRRSPADVVPNRAAGYALVDGVLKNAAYMGESRSGSGSGGLLSTAVDLARWDLALDGGGPLRRDTLEEMWKPVRLKDGTTVPYGYGWGLETTRGQRSIGHGGFTNGFRSSVKRFPDLRLTVIVLVNLQDADPDRILEGIAALYEPSLREAARKPLRGARSQGDAVTLMPAGKVEAGYTAGADVRIVMRCPRPEADGGGGPVHLLQSWKIPAGALPDALRHRLDTFGGEADGLPAAAEDAGAVRVLLQAKGDRGRLVAELGGQVAGTQERPGNEWCGGAVEQDAAPGDDL
jgi:CubicO group peptidase (beta-lactamase class C family)